jgi:hypothetical protein
MMKHLLPSVTFNHSRWSTSYVSLAIVACLNPFNLTHPQLVDMKLESKLKRTTDKGIMARINRARCSTIPYNHSSMSPRRSEASNHVGSEERPSNGGTSIEFQAKGAYLSVRGYYYNYDYGYSVVIPKRLTGFRASAPAPNHGFGIKLSADPESTLWVDASYNAAEWKSLDEAIKYYMDRIKDEGATRAAIIRRTPSRFGKLPGRRFVISYNASDSREMVKEIVLAMRQAQKEGAVVYMIELTSPADRYNKDKRVIRELLKSWRLKRLP